MPVILELVKNASYSGRKQALFIFLIMVLCEVQCETEKHQLFRASLSVIRRLDLTSTVHLKKRNALNYKTILIAVVIIKLRKFFKVRLLYQTDTDIFNFRAVNNSSY